MLAILFATLLFTTADKPLELDGVVTFRRGFDPYYFGSWKQCEKWPDVG